MESIDCSPLIEAWGLWKGERKWLIFITLETAYEIPQASLLEDGCCEYINTLLTR